MQNNKTEEWWKKSTVYQVFPKSFKDTTGNGKGDLKGLTEKLGYLEELGIDMVWLMPIYVSPQNDNGYDVADYCSIDPDFGTMEDFDKLMLELQKRKMHLMLDIVVNHSSTEHIWFQESRKSKDNPFREYYIWKDPAPNGGPPNNWQSKFGGSAWQLDKLTGQYYLALYDKTQADLNWENPVVREQAIKLMEFWAKKGVSGFRLDVINVISKRQDFPDDDGSIAPGDGRKFYTDGPRIHEFLKELNRRVFKPYNLVTVGELSSTSLENCILYSNPKQEEMSMTFNFHHLKVDYPNGQKWVLMAYDFEEFKSLLSKWQVGMQAGGGWNALFLNNHDQPRALSRFLNDGEYRIESAKLLATTLHGLQGTPYVFQGEEIGLPNPLWKNINEMRDVESHNMYRILQEQGKSPEEAFAIISERSRDNSRTPMLWNSDPGAGFTTGTPWIKLDERYPSMNVEKQLVDPESVFHHYKKLISLRKELDIFTEGTFVRLDNKHPQIFAYGRYSNEESLLVVSNFSDITSHFSFPDDIAKQWPAQGKRNITLLSSSTVEAPQLSSELTLPPYGSYMWLVHT